MKKRFLPFILALVFFGTFGAVQAATVLFPSGGGTGWGFPGGIQAHSVILGNGLNQISTTSPSTSGYVLTSNGTSADPTFQPAAGGSSAGLATTSPWVSGNLAQVVDNGHVTSIATSSLGLLTTNVAEGSNLYYTTARSLASFITNLAATSSVASITTLSSLSLPYSQLTGTPSITNYFTLTGNNLQNNVGNALGINTAPSIAALEVQASSTTGNAFTAWSTTGSNLLSILNNGNVGVGTSSPNSPLSIRGGNLASGTNRGVVQIGASAGTSNGGSEIGVATVGSAGNLGYLQGFGFANGNAQAIAINPFGGNTLLNSTTGNVGIGTTTPAYLLDVASSAGQSGIFGDNVGNANSYVGFSGGASVLSGRALFGYDSAFSGGGSSGAAVVQGTAGKGIEFNVGNNAFASGNAAVITVGGNFGIASSSPQSLLSVGGQNELGLFGDAGNSNSYVGFAGTGAGNNNGRAYFGYDANGNAIVQGSASKGIEFAVNNSTFTSGVVAVLTSAGNFGIGTTSPGSALSIAGNIFLGGNIIATSTATSSFASDINIPAGHCYQIAGVCPSSGGSGTVTSIATNNGLTGGTITTSGTIGLATIAANSVLGNITGASAVPTAVATSSLFLNASASNSGLLTSTDWNTFNGKQSALTFGTGLTNTAGTVTVNTSQNITNLTNLNTAGFVQTTGTGGLLSVAGLTSGQVTGALGFTPFGGTNPLPIANGGTNATSQTTSGNVEYYNGTSIATAPATSAVTVPYASSTAISTVYASSTKMTAGQIFVPSKGTPSGSFTAWDPTGQLISTSTPGGSVYQIHTQVFTSSGTFPVPSGVTKAVVQIGGSSGGSGAMSAGSGGTGGSGSGGYAEKLVDLSATTSVEVDIGAGGNPGLVATPVNATAGGTTRFSTFMSCAGSSGTAGGAGSLSSPTAGGICTGGDINSAGQTGTGGFGYKNTSSSNQYNPGIGYPSTFGSTYGGGANGSGGDGNPGNPGILIVTWVAP